MNNKYTTIIGLEVHIEPNTNSKMFCSCPQDHFGKQANTQTCPICLGLPGALPFANSQAIEKTIKLGLALGSKISKKSIFYRKHYFYSDLPKSFQTSQKDNPFCVGGELLSKKIDHIHLEEDAGKLIHQVVDGKKVSLIDFNRSGCALIELVTKPVFNEIDEVLSFLRELQLIARYLNISNADMEKGTMRLEANISLSKDGQLPNYKVELKNINSFRFLEKALKAEIKRQSEALDKGLKLEQETRGYDETTQTTFSQRTKSGSDDYRYFPEADLPPIETSDEDIKRIQGSIPELPNEKRIRFKTQYNISKDFIEILVSDPSRASYFEEAAKFDNNYKLIANLMVNKKMDSEFREPAGLIKKIKEIETTEFATPNDVETAVSSVILENPDIVTSYKNGKGQVIGFLIGQAQKKLQGKANPKELNDILLKFLNK
ncbi:MAG: Asp-tRNA(Asn)/Glu-tRNA(Gln) amidotransferase subunit GatB [bacterium]|nr:MAG: Asp-tRNA(Asn)/Glu-tRNA(Gln) amidotransferase subunit GatB [bacterium]